MRLNATRSSAIFRWFNKIIRRPDWWLFATALTLLVLSACLLNTWPAARYTSLVMLVLAFASLVGIVGLSIGWYRSRRAGRPRSKLLIPTLIVLLIITLGYGFFGWYGTGLTTKEIATAHVANHSYHLVSTEEIGCTTQCEPTLTLYHCDGPELICPFVPGLNLDCECRSSDYRSLRLDIDQTGRSGRILSVQGRIIARFNFT